MHSRIFPLIFFLFTLVFACREETVPEPLVPVSGNALEINADPASLRYAENLIYLKATVNSSNGFSIEKRGICFGKSNFPSLGRDSLAEGGAGSGTYETAFSLPDYSVSWYARAFAVSKSPAGKMDTSYSNQLQITPHHQSKPLQTQALSTDSIRVIWNGIRVCRIPGLEEVALKGICWSLSPGARPTGNNFVTLSSGDSLGFTTFITGLQPGTLYYFRAFALNSADTAFGAEYGCSTGLTDAENNFYPTILIGKQVWMAANLRVTRFSDGSSLEVNPDNARWDSTGLPACASSSNDVVFGKFYNYFSVSGDRQLCPAGWKIPVRADWDSLFRTLGGWETAGLSMKTVNSAWGPVAEGQGGSGFNALPAGKKAEAGNISQTGLLGYWWINSGSTIPAAFRVTNLDKGVFAGNHQPNEGLSVRCIKKP